MAIRAMQDQQEENNEDEGDAEQHQKSEGDSLPLKHALENEDEEVLIKFQLIKHKLNSLNWLILHLL